MSYNGFKRNDFKDPLLKAVGGWYNKEWYDGKGINGGSSIHFAYKALPTGQTTFKSSLTSEKSDSLSVDGRMANDPEFIEAATSFLKATGQTFSSGYRTITYINDKNKGGKSKNRAPGGGSEHQTGYALDIPNINLKPGSAIHKKLVEHGPKYGFIQTFTAHSNKLTYVMDEPWHWKWLGNAKARSMLTPIDGSLAGMIALSYGSIDAAIAETKKVKTLDTGTLYEALKSDFEALKAGKTATGSGTGRTTNGGGGSMWSDSDFVYGWYRFKQGGVSNDDSEANFNKWYSAQDDKAKAYVDKFYNYVVSNISNKSTVPPKWRLCRTGGQFGSNCERTSCGSGAGTTCFTLNDYKKHYGNDFTKENPIPSPFAVPPMKDWPQVPRTIDMLAEFKARGITTGECVIVSGFRNPWHNCAVNSSPRSAHTRGGAYDIGGCTIDVAKVAKFWRDHGDAYQMGIGFYKPIPSNRLYTQSWHLDTFTIGKRCWGDSRTSADCPLPNIKGKDYGALPDGFNATPKSKAPAPDIGGTGGTSADGTGAPVQTAARTPTFTGAPSVCKTLEVDPRVKEAFELAFKQLYPDGKVDFGPVPTSQPPLGQTTPPPAGPGSGAYTQAPTSGSTVGSDGTITTPTSAGNFKYSYPDVSKGGTAAIWVPEFGKGKKGGTDGSSGSGSAYFFGDSIIGSISSGVGAVDQRYDHDGTMKQAADPNYLKCKAVSVKGAKGHKFQAVGSTNPWGIACYLDGLKNKLSGKHVVLSTGASNAWGAKDAIMPDGKGLNADNLGKIRKQLEIIRDARATCTILGVCENFVGYGLHTYKGNPKTSAAINEQLRNLAIEFKFEFTGPLNTCTDTIHPSKSSLRDMYVNAGSLIS